MRQGGEGAGGGGCAGMFYGQQVLGRKAPLGRCWLLGCGRSVGRRAILKEDVGQACELILEPEVPMALRLSAVLMHGVVLVHRTQVEFTLRDVDKASRDLRRLAAPAAAGARRSVGARRGAAGRDQTVLADAAGNIFQITFIPPDGEGDGEDPLAAAAPAASFGRAGGTFGLSVPPSGLDDHDLDGGSEWFEMTRASAEGAAAGATPSRSFEGARALTGSLLGPRGRGSAGLSLSYGPPPGGAEVFEAAELPTEEVEDMAPPALMDDDMAPPVLMDDALPIGGGLSSLNDGPGSDTSSGTAKKGKRKRKLMVDEDEVGEAATILDNAVIRRCLRSTDHLRREPLLAEFWQVDGQRPLPRPGSRGGAGRGGTLQRKHVEEALRNIPQVSGVTTALVLRHGLPRPGGPSAPRGGRQTNLARLMSLFSRGFPSKERYLGGLSRKKRKTSDAAEGTTGAGAGPSGTSPEALRYDSLDEMLPVMDAPPMGDAGPAPSGTHSDVPSEVEKLRGLLAPEVAPSPGFRRSISPGSAHNRASRGSAGRASVGGLLETPGVSPVGPDPEGLTQLGLSQFELLTQSHDPNSDSQLPESQRAVELSLTPECLQTLQYLELELRKLGTETGKPGEIELLALLRRARLNRIESARVFYRLLVLHSNRLLHVSQAVPFGEVRVTLWPDDADADAPAQPSPFSEPLHEGTSPQTPENSHPTHAKRGPLFHCDGSSSSEEYSEYSSEEEGAEEH